MADWWPAPEGVRVSPDGSWSVGEFRIVHLPSLRFLKERLVFEDEGAFLVEGERRLPVAVDGPAFQVVELRLDAEAAEARVVLDDGSEEVLGHDTLGTDPNTGLAVTTNLNINFLRKGQAGQDILAEARLLKLGKRRAVQKSRMGASNVRKSG